MADVLCPCACPTAFEKEVARAAALYSKVYFVNHWNVCCRACAARPPAKVFRANLRLADVDEAHGVSLQGVLRTAERFARDDSSCNLTDRYFANIRTTLRPTSSSDLTDAARTSVDKLSAIYNRCALELPTGSTLHICCTDGDFRVRLNTAVFVDETSRRPGCEAREPLTPGPEPA